MDTKISINSINNSLNITNRNIRKNPAFGSRNCPVEPFSIKTDAGILNVEELTLKNIKEAADFTVKSNIKTFADEAKEYNSLSSIEKGYYRDSFMYMYAYHFVKEDGNTTILAGRDKNGEIKSLFSMNEFDFTTIDKHLLEHKTGYIDECMVDEAYRSKGVGNVMIEKLLKTAKGQFTDVILMARNKAVNFYSRHGFQPFNPADCNQASLNNQLSVIFKSEGRGEAMVKSLDGQFSCFKRLSKSITRCHV